MFSCAIGLHLCHLNFSSAFILSVCEQRRQWRVCAYAPQCEKYQNPMRCPNYFVFLSSSRFHNEEKTRKYYLRLRDRIKSKVIPLLKVYDRKSLHVTNRHCISSEQTARKKKKYLTHGRPAVKPWKGFRDTWILAKNLKGYGIFCNYFKGIWDTWINFRDMGIQCFLIFEDICHIYFRDMGYFSK